MSTENAIGYLKSEALIAVMRDEDIRDQERPLLRLFNRRSHRGERIAVRRRTRRPGQLHHTTIGGQSVPVRSGAWTEDFYSPSYIKVHSDLTAADVALFVDADSAQPNDIVREDANARIRELATDLREDDAEERFRMCLGVMTDELAFRQAGQAADTSVDMSLNELTSHTANWDNSAATIVSDILGMIKEYRDNNDKGLPPTHVLYNPDMFQDTILGNTEWNTYKKQDESLARGYLGIPGGMRDADNLGVLVPLFGLNWVPITGKYVNIAGTTVDRFSKYKLAFFRLDDGSMPLFEWGMLRDPFHNPMADYNVELLMPQKGHPVKTARATLFDNGLPIIKNPQLVQWATIYS